MPFMCGLAGGAPQLPTTFSSAAATAQALQASWEGREASTETLDLDNSAVAAEQLAAYCSGLPHAAAAAAAPSSSQDAAAVEQAAQVGAAPFAPASGCKQLGGACHTL